ncbi:hypothetical protein RHGRI_004686 [Rhododendron griersonianum]|uniref:Ribosomal protein L36 n=1 Tax=Rhododendron griersonianum TaxID=479676 RepID=A0AAV6ISS2_9ERIC|nr:hypothetical protein RHGRI_026417 [Rhododendron griersonianum]KAG5544949.1 hypothetical protein RHGRI_017420 [Rhododendron griersonianum]KAG5548834.1 hypothetical protein RHGRI_014252 [Rhododendron griersonianum]KAG5561720.1 hypothetical protein RHGRI_004686 [Rhododendron griersonianum]
MEMSPRRRKRNSMSNSCLSTICKTSTRICIISNKLEVLMSTQRLSINLLLELI